MAKLLFKLSGVPEDESEEIRLLLENAKIDYYETSSGFLGLSFAAIWINDDAQLTNAISILSEYHNQRYSNAQLQQRELRENNQQLTRWMLFKSSPITSLLIFLFIGAVLYLSISPFFFNR